MQTSDCVNERLRAAAFCLLLGRYFILHKYGGVYLDCDVQCYRCAQQHRPINWPCQQLTPSQSCCCQLVLLQRCRCSCLSSSQRCCLQAAIRRLRLTRSVLKCASPAHTDGTSYACGAAGRGRTSCAALTWSSRREAAGPAGPTACKPDAPHSSVHGLGWQAGAMHAGREVRRLMPCSAGSAALLRVRGLRGLLPCIGSVRAAAAGAAAAAAGGNWQPCRLELYA